MRHWSYLILLLLHFFRSKQTVKFSDQDANSIAVSFCKVTPMAKNYDSGVVQFSMEHVTINENQRSYSSESWLHKGGVGRNHDVLMELHMTKVIIFLRLNALHDT